MSRGHDAPMDFEFTDKDRDRNLIAQSPFSTAQKREFTQLGVAPSTPQRAFAATNNTPFLFHTPAPSTPYANQWQPSLVQMPQPHPHPYEPEIADVSMPDASPAAVHVEPSRNQPHDDDADDADADEDDDERSARRPIGTGAVRRTYKRRQEQSALTKRKTRRRRHDSDSDEQDDEDGDDADVNKSPSLAKRLNVYFNPLAQMGPTSQPVQQDLPQTLVGYVQFLFNLSVVFVALYLAIAFIVTVQRDVEHRVTENSLTLLAEISTCRTEWEANHCASEYRAPVLVHQCAEWQACMNRDPTVVGRARVTAEMVGEVVNGFVEPISWKALIFTLTSASIGILLVNTLLSLYRVRHAEALALNARLHQQHQQHQSGYYGHVPPIGYGPGWTHAGGAVAEPDARRRRIE
ncbi:nuclear membrane protein [Auriculariales sp. MPI-PUGE-AT-0066]|nr:nuclear membrane protein [Auriculariales sp. MPI-PUGE-AT-0066]